MQDYWMDTEQIAKEVNVHVATVMRLIQNGKLRATKVGHQWRIKRSDWEDYLTRSSNIPLKDEE